MSATLVRVLDCTAELLGKLITDRKPVLWVGAGMSIAAGYPAAAGLIEAMRQKAFISLAGDDYCAVADGFLAEEGIGSLMDLMAQLYPPSYLPTPWHHAVARLYKAQSFATVITTNYDGLLEHAFREANCEFDVQTLDRNQELAGPKRLLKIHGSSEDYQSLVLSQESYRQYARKYSFLKQQLELLFIQQSILFVGCSMADPRILEWLLKLSTKVRTKVKPWFALLTQSDIEKLKTSYRNSTISEILAKVPFQVLRVSGFDHVPQLFQTIAPAQALDPATRPRAAVVGSVPAHSTNSAPALAAPVIEVPPCFVGRTAQLAQLEAGLRVTSTQVIYQLRGSGGVGKSALARMAAARCHQNFDCVLSFYMAEQTPQAFAVVLARELGVEITEPGDDRAARRDISRLLGQGRYLLLLDNLTSVATVANLLPEGTQTRVLITTRERAIWQALNDSRPDLTVTSLEVGMFEVDENRQLFQRVLGGNYREQDLAEYDAIGQTLGFLPVALRLAVNWMVYPPRLSAAELREKLQKEKLKVLGEVRNKGVDDSLKNLQTVFQLDEKMTQSQRRVLRHLAVCAEGPVPFSFLQRFHGGNADRLRNDLEELYERSWCERNQGEEREYELHVLVRALIVSSVKRPCCFGKKWAINGG